MTTMDVVTLQENENSESEEHPSNSSVADTETDDRPTLKTRTEPEIEQKPQTAFRRASAVLFKKLLPQSYDSVKEKDPKQYRFQKKAKKERNECLSKLLSALYCKTLVLFGLVLPLTEVLIDDVSPHIYQAFYMYICSGSLLYLFWMYAAMAKDRTVVNILNSYRGDAAAYEAIKKRFRGPVNRYGSFYLRLGAVGFGIGSMVYSGLEFGQVLEMEGNPNCADMALALTPAFRMLLTIAQMQFIFLNSQNVDLCRKPVVSRFGLMHLIGTNLCEWLNVIIQESKHDIDHLRDHHHHSMDHNESLHDYNSTECWEVSIMGSLVRNVSPFLFPCTIEYSLICAVIMLDMWMDVKSLPKSELLPRRPSVPHTTVPRPSHVFTVDCANSHKGLFCGSTTLVATVICLIVYFVFIEHSEFTDAALLEIDCCEMSLYVVCFFVVCSASVKLSRASSSNAKSPLSMDSCLLIMGQSGVSLFSAFRFTGLLLSHVSYVGLSLEVLRFVQSLTQTIFIVYGCTLVVHSKASRPARQLVTFLLPSNMAIWLIDTLIRNRATSDIQLLALFGPWAWTTVVRIAMPLAIFYRFHSTICLLEIWKNAYKHISLSESV